MRWLIPRLAGFQGAHPDIALHLSVGGGPVEFQRDRINLAIRRLDFGIPDAWQVQRLFSERVGPVLSPQLVPAFERGEYIALGSKTRPNAWAHWLERHPSVPRPSEIRYFDHHFLIVEAASAGLGVALSPLVLVIDDLDKKRLVGPLGFDVDGSHYGLIWRDKADLVGPGLAVADWLHEECSRSFS
jgi:DNA-binding transcriptional LysR family regulator